MTTPGRITYNPSAVQAVATDFQSNGAALTEIHSDMVNVTNGLAEFFAGAGADEFFSLQDMFLSGLRGLADTIGRHGAVTGTVLHGAMARDAALRSVFGLG